MKPARPFPIKENKRIIKLWHAEECLGAWKTFRMWVYSCPCYKYESATLNLKQVIVSGVEVSPLCSYAGENLEAICRGRTFHAPSEITF